jgi:adenylate kinase
MIIILLGAPGVGKGTQAKLLADKYHLKILSTGEILRKAVKEKTELGRKAEKIINKGDLVSDDIVCTLIENELMIRDENFNGYILDGFPRTIEQAKKLDLICAKNNLNKPYIVTLNLTEEEIVRRLSARFYCSNCNQSYNSITNPTKVKGICDKCLGQTFYIRKDDKAEIIELRLTAYLNQTKPLIQYYCASKNYYSIEADQDIQTIYSKVTFFVDQSIKVNSS